MAKGIKRKLDRAIKKLGAEIASDYESKGFFGRGMSREGYQGGYEQALMDVELALNGTQPNTKYWHDET